MKHAELFLAELASRWSERPVTLNLLGATALAVQVDFARGTRDADVLQTLDLNEAARAHLLELAGPGTTLAARWKLHVQIVPNGIPFLPHPPTWNRVALPGAPTAVSIRALDVVDVVVSKLKRFSANDRSDIDAMISAGHVSHDRLIARFLSAVDGFLGDAREGELPRYVDNLHEVERDAFGVEESEIELPDWIDR